MLSPTLIASDTTKALFYALMRMTADTDQGAREKMVADFQDFIAPMLQHGDVEPAVALRTNESVKSAVMLGDIEATRYVASVVLGPDDLSLQSATVWRDGKASGASAFIYCKATTGQQLGTGLLLGMCEAPVALAAVMHAAAMLTEVAMAAMTPAGSA
jgi:hypothetical protein